MAVNAERAAEHVRWRRVRFALGMAQMAVVVLVLLLSVGECSPSMAGTAEN
jgi:hypothetical protein